MKTIPRFHQNRKLIISNTNILLALVIFFLLSVLPVNAATSSVVAVIDSGIDQYHIVLQNKIVGGFDFTGGHSPYTDNVGHGTAMASIIASGGSTPGLCSNCRLMSLKVTDSMEAPVDRIAQAIEYAVTMGVKVISVGAGSNSGSEALRLAVERAAAYGIPVIAPAGTQGLSHPLFPAAYESVVSVVGVTLTGQTISNSNFGGLGAVFAPGKRVLAAKSGGGYMQVTGSSPASAWKAGEIAEQLPQSDAQGFVQKIKITGLQSQQKPSKAIARLQYADTDDHDLVVDAPWRTIRSYLPVLFFTPEFNGAFIENFQLSNYDPATKNKELIFKDDVEGFDDKRICQGNSGVKFINIIDDFGSVRNLAKKDENIKDFWHYIARIPTECIGIGANRGKIGEHFLSAVIRWKTITRNHNGDQISSTRTYKRMLRIIVDNENGTFPKFHPRDHHYDIHVHTIAETTSWGVANNDSARKAFGGPIAMLLDSAYALGLVDIPLKDGNWSDYKDRIATTDHNVFYSRNPYDSGHALDFGPTKRKYGFLEEFNWYRKHFGGMGGEEVTLEGAGANDDLLKLQKLIKTHFNYINGTT